MSAAFDAYCAREGITSGPHREAIEPTFNAGYAAGLADSAEDLSDARCGWEAAVLELMDADQTIAALRAEIAWLHNSLI